MDKKGFDLVDQQYQHELSVAKQKITQKWQGYYANKQYVGTPEMQAKARANDNAQMRQKINAELSGFKTQLGKTHFGDKGREDTYKEVQRQQQIQERKEQIKKEFERKSNDNKRQR